VFRKVSAPYYGVWDYDGFYDLQTDPHERPNLITVPARQDPVEATRKQLFDELEASGGLDIRCSAP
jgi:N-acetylglucosamine-6-sulfatase